MASKQANPKAKKAPKVKQMELPNAAAGVVTRFPPEPSGYLHIGHAKAALLNDHFAHVQYPRGKLILRFDDTNTEKENKEFQDAIREDVALLGIKPDQVSYTSDYFDLLDEYCVQMIKAGKAYADDTPGELIKEQRKAKEPSARRDESIEHNLQRFELMKTSPDGANWCIRAKISYANDNVFLRDPVIYRCPKSQLPHHRMGTKYKAYPTYQFACPIVDSLERVTHALRTTEYNEQDSLYKWVLKALGLCVPFIWTFSKIEFVRTLMSKRKLAKLVDSGAVSGWDDPRFPTVRGIRRRGMTVEGLRDFMVSQGPSKNVVKMDWHTIWAINKKVIDPQAGRYTAINSDCVNCTISAQEVHFEEKPRHAKYDLGQKKVYYGPNIVIEREDAEAFKIGEEVTLMNWGNAIVKDLVHDNENPSHLTRVIFDLNLGGDFKSTKKITWLSTNQQLMPAELVDFDHLLAIDKLEKDEKDWEKFLTPVTERRTRARADCNVWDVRVNDILQFDRKGYYRCDQAASNNSPGIFFKIPSGREE